MFGSKSKGLFVDIVGDVILAARTTGVSPPFTIEEVREFDRVGSSDPIADVRSFAGARSNGYAPARCSVYPDNRVISRIPVEGRKLREDGYLEARVAEVLKIDPESHSLFTLSPVNGADPAATKGPPREVLVCGAPFEELLEAQSRILEFGLYPDRLEIGTIAALGGITSYLAHGNSRGPTLVLEIGRETTQVFVISRDGVEVTRAVDFGISSMIPLVQQELALKDEAAAHKLFFSNTFDFTGMGPQLTKRLLRELQASIGFYEVQTGQSISQLCCTMLPSKVEWLQRTLADVLGMKVLEIDRVSWLRTMGIDFAPGISTAALGPAWTGLFCLMGDYNMEVVVDEAAA